MQMFNKNVKVAEFAAKTLGYYIAGYMDMCCEDLLDRYTKIELKNLIWSLI
jgi:hypothetical protein